MQRIRIAILVLSLTIIWAFSSPGQNTDTQSLLQKYGYVRTTPEEAQAKSAGCLSCHNGIEDMHNGRVSLGCTDCHGGNAQATSAGSAAGTKAYEEAKKSAHPKPKYPDVWKTSANPERTYALLNKENLDWIRFVNPGDLRAVSMSCGQANCHVGEIHNVSKSMMTTGAMLWGTALYNNGSYRRKYPAFGESYAPDGTPQRIQTIPAPTDDEIRLKGVLPYLDPLPRWEITQMGNILRTFEKGGRKATEVGLPNSDEANGRPTQNLLSPRELGTLLRVDPVFIGLQKTRLLDPMLTFLGTNDQPGDYRSSGCTACHVVYANDRDPYHSGPYASFGHTGFSATGDPTIPKNEPGHPIKHQFTRSIPSSQCVVCHMHPGTLMEHSYYGFTWWDLETDSDQLYPKQSKKLTSDEAYAITERNPEGSALRGKWGDEKFLENLTDLNPTLQHTQFGDFTPHGWIFRSIFKHDKQGNLLDPDGKVVNDVTPDKLMKAVNGPATSGLPVHLKDIHLEVGMHCVDCHFLQDNHGNGKLYGEPRNAVEIGCVDCHGTIERRADPTVREAKTSGPAGPNKMLDYRNTGYDQERFFMKDGKLYQRGSVDKDKVWEVVQVIDTITLGNTHYNAKSALAKTIQKDGKTWGGVPSSSSQLAHANENMTCFACHSSWVPTCMGCHLAQKANQKKTTLHNEGETLRNWTSYNFQTLRDDIFMLGRDGTVTGKKIAPVRSACAIMVSSQNASREWIYSQQQTVSSEGYSGISFSTHVPHTVRARETKTCTDCHVSSANDNNAQMAMTLIQGTNFYNFLGRYVYVGEEKGYEAVVVTEHDEPQAVIGSYLHRMAYPENYQLHKQNHDMLKEAYEKGGDGVRSLQLRGEYLYAAKGKGGFEVFDVANIDEKGFSERMTTAPVSPLGQKFHVDTKFATAVASPTTLGVDPTRPHLPENEEAIYRDDKQPIPLVYGYLYVTDKYEGLIEVFAGTLLDGDPTNNFLKRDVVFNPDGLLNGANNITVAGFYAYITCDKGLVILNLQDPTKPRIVATIGSPWLKNPRAVQIQFRYAFVLDAEGMKVLDITDTEKPKPVNTVVPLGDARNLYLVRTYAYVAAGKQGLAIIDITNPEKPKLDQTYDANGQMEDANDVKVGMTNVSQFAYVADGKNGLRVLQLTSPEKTPGIYGYSPRPAPELIATYHTHEPALAISEGLDRDRAVDESGNQLSVFGRRGARPFNLDEMHRMYLRDGQLWTVPELKDVDDVEKYYGKPTGAPSTVAEKRR
ncbi:MAG: hypothetical protein C5B54_03725 [Acidobacteria bacterium]|nr:MAG: hypothetical protein C5B54_03725 [Acidobacteriota bacterium]